MLATHPQRGSLKTAPSPTAIINRNVLLFETLNKLKYQFNGIGGLIKGQLFFSS